MKNKLNNATASFGVISHKLGVHTKEWSKPQGRSHFKGEVVASCERCWDDAYIRSCENPMKSQAKHYHDLLKERKDHSCSPEEQAGQWWDEEKQCDSRK